MYLFVSPIFLRRRARFSRQISASNHDQKLPPVILNLEPQVPKQLTIARQASQNYSYLFHRR
ncbi:BQ5605_C009g05722 [Microbotryum silenes-dioicae]|uniref:BQ5605_C009g05722 protein n=1 Tax=Microbotryum silenes-dioicae TaxID=796604 RepID=A0A2X0MIJ2_9BASI|nr:BQ5605_C009g05722 [Microbotryum silenes-dioicae]